MALALLNFTVRKSNHILDIVKEDDQRQDKSIYYFAKYFCLDRTYMIHPTAGHKNLLNFLQQKEGAR